MQARTCSGLPGSIIAGRRCLSECQRQVLLQLPKLLKVIHLTPRAFRYFLILSLHGLILGSLVFDFFYWRERPDSATGVALELGPVFQRIKAGEAPRLVLTIFNRGNREVMLVTPGDGSWEGWRTPRIAFSRGSLPRGGCGCKNPLMIDEVFTLKPGEARELEEWISAVCFSRPGRYKLALRFTNEPDCMTNYGPTSAKEQAALNAFRRTTPVSAVSNTVEIVVERR